jgi:quercetin dioxygenase-like cupin family protein
VTAYPAGVACWKLCLMNETQAFERQAEGSLTSVESSAAEGFMAPLHAHEADEAVQVLEGAITVYAGEESVQLEAGETFVVERGVAHTYRADSPQTRFVFTTFTRSASRYESFLRAAGPVAGDAGWSTDEDAAIVGAVAAAARITVFGPPGMLPQAVETVRAA